MFENQFWKSTAEREGFRDEPPPEGISRRGFLEAAGFTLTLAAAGGCQRAPVTHLVPPALQASDQGPGRVQLFASTCGACPAGCGMLVRVRDGRPLKMEGMPEHPLSRGGLCAVGQAQTLGLYDSQRLTGPLDNGQPAKWPEVDAAIAAALKKIQQAGGAVRVVTPTITSPTLQAAIDGFLKRFADGKHVVFDPISVSAILDAHELTNGRRMLPRYRFDQAKMIVSLDADFLGTWISPVEFTAGWREGRTLPQREEKNGNHGTTENHKSHDSHKSHSPAQTIPIDPASHWQFESRMTLTGANADRRFRVRPEELGLVAAHLAQRITKLAGDAADATKLADPPIAAAELNDLAERLWKHRGASLVVCGAQDLELQTLVNRLNERLGNYGHTLDVDQPSRQRQSDDGAVQQFVADLKAGKISALFVAGVDPLHDLPDAAALTDALKSLALTVSLSERLDDFSAAAQFVCPEPHPLETWLDAEPVAGLLSLRQPTILPLGQTRSALESFSIWSGEPASSALDLLKKHWQKHLFPRQTAETDFRRFWEKAVHDGFVALPHEAQAAPAESSKPAEGPSINLGHWSIGLGHSPPSVSLVLHAQIAIPDSRHAHNAWLQELPDPVTKITWDNCLAISPALAREMNLADNDVVRVSVDGVTLDAPVFIQPGQHDRVVSLALGYGVRGTERFAAVGPQWIQSKSTVGENGLVGVNAAPLLKLSGGAMQYVRGGVKLEKTGRRHVLATTQLHDSIELPPSVAPPGIIDRGDLLQEITLAEFRENPAAGAPHAHHGDARIWPDDHPYEGHRWGMVIDLNACSGCSACLIACQAENNVPVVGRDEVRRHREMHWIRIDRYYSGDEADPAVSHQPMMCQHCANAPCETVCPVVATVHSSEGLNQQVYNRCVGTRYCANNCPYKVRRFNWFDYAHNDSLQNLALNPDVTVRMRGIMEKCSMCVQRIQEAKIETRRTVGGLADGAIQTACEQSCPAGAIVFGDLNDPKSRISAAVRDGRFFRVLEELNVQPAVGYLRKVRNDI